MSELAEQAAREIAAGALTPPIDVWGLAESWGVQVRERDMAADGRLVHCDGAVEIHVSAKTGQARRRFTIAHELGHLWVQHSGAAGFNYDIAIEERFCNAFAAALLIPSEWLWGTVGTRSENLTLLRRVARLSQTSLSAMLIRLRELLGWRSSLLRYHYECGEWRLQAVTAVAASLLGRLTDAPSTADALALAAAQGSLRAQLPLQLDQRLISCDAEIRADWNSAIVLAEIETTKGTQPSAPDPGCDMARQIYRWPTSQPWDARAEKWFRLVAQGLPGAECPTVDSQAPYESVSAWVDRGPAAPHLHWPSDGKYGR